jgi:hypothetical protein
LVVHKLKIAIGIFGILIGFTFGVAWRPVVSDDDRRDALPRQLAEAAPD